MGNTCSSCSSFRASFKPNAQGGGPTKLQRGNSRLLPKPPTSNEVDPKADPSAANAASPADAGEHDGRQDILVVKSLDLHLKENGKEHHTGWFEVMGRAENPNLVVRRGFGFLLSITFNRAYDAAKDAISFIFTVEDAEKPSHGQGTLVAVPLLDKGEESGGTWSAALLANTEDVIQVQITTAADTIVGKWKMDIDTKLRNDGAVSYSHKDPIYVLFNPWSQKDQVFLDNADACDEYVLADTGLLWKGNKNNYLPSAWKYAQYEKDILECAVYVMTKVGNMSIASRSDAVATCRALSAAVNHSDDGGVLIGNWSTDHSGGTPPWKWIGSMKILQKYYKTKKPVKYGQCWVFAGVQTTICRALGIPCRPVTNYNSAHDTEGSLTIDYYFDDRGKEMDELKSDSVWNFHVWNEVWMERPDLGEGDYGGWQAIDSTPQELSNNMYRMGPASIAAIKRGEVKRPYDGGFVFAEVNADKVFWHYTGPNAPLKLIRKDSQSIGTLISTKAIGKWEREDITSNYKHPETSEAERTTMLRALRANEMVFSRYYLNEEFNDVRFDFEMRDDITIGSPFSVVLRITNRSETQDYSVSGVLRVDVVLYTGVVKCAVKTEDFDCSVKAKSVETVSMEVTYNEYSKRLVENCAFNISCLAKVKDTEYEYFAQDDFRVKNPEIKISLEGEAIQGEELTAVATVKNPLPVPLKKPKFTIEGPGIPSQLKIKLKENVGVNGESSATFKFIPPYDGKATLVTKFSSSEINDVDGFLNFMIVKKKGVNGGAS
ncbi:Annulin [Gryllus bimaculatus]|nr:Annulin [Gryllus bimaculatus]